MQLTQLFASLALLTTAVLGNPLAEAEAEAIPQRPGGRRQTCSNGGLYCRNDLNFTDQQLRNAVNRRSGQSIANRDINNALYYCASNGNSDTSPTLIVISRCGGGGRRRGNGTDDGDGDGRGDDDEDNDEDDDDEGDNRGSCASLNVRGGRTIARCVNERQNS